MSHVAPTGSYPFFSLLIAFRESLPVNDNVRKVMAAAFFAFSLYGYFKAAGMIIPSSPREKTVPPALQDTLNAWAQGDVTKQRAVGNILRAYQSESPSLYLSGGVNDGNRLTTLPAGVFKKEFFPHLKELKLSCNNLLNIEAIENLPKLEILDLAYNTNLTTLSSNGTSPFEKFPSLKQIILTGNPLLADNSREMGQFGGNVDVILVKHPTPTPISLTKPSSTPYLLFKAIVLMSAMGVAFVSTAVVVTLITAAILVGPKGANNLLLDLPRV